MLDASSASAPPRVGLVEKTFDCAVTALVWGRDVAMFALGDGTLRFWSGGRSDPSVLTPHRGAILCAVADGSGEGVVTGGDDGRLVHSLIDGRSTQMAETGGKWIDHVALAPWGGLAWAHGQSVELASPKEKRSRVLKLPSSCGGLAFAPKGQRLAIAHYGGATLASFAHFDSPPDPFVWKGSHIAITWSPDARFLVTAMQEQSVHVWRVSDKADLHMRGYPSKPRSFSWSERGQVLATSGGPGALLWPFAAKDGPRGATAEELGQHMTFVTAVAWHPHSPVLALGYRNGLVALAESASGRMLYLREPDGQATTHIAWRRDGALLAFGSEGGAAGLIDCSGLKA